MSNNSKKLAGFNIPKWSTQLSSGTAVIAIGTLLSSCAEDSTSTTSKSETNKSAKVETKKTGKPDDFYSTLNIYQGDTVELVSDKTCAQSPEDYQELNKAITAGDKDGIAELLADGKIWTYEPKTRMLILDSKLVGFAEMLFQVRVINGAQAGLKWWTNSEKSDSPAWKVVDRGNVYWSAKQEQ